MKRRRTLGKSRRAKRRRTAGKRDDGVRARETATPQLADEKGEHQQRGERDRRLERGQQPLRGG